MRNGACYQREPWAPAINASASLLWPSARSEDAESCGNHPQAADSLTGVAPQWRAESARPTPCEDNANNVGGPSRTTGIGRGGYQDLTVAVTQWPTPSSRDEKGENGEAHLKNGTGRLHLDQLPNFIRYQWTTPQAHDVTQCGSGQQPTSEAGNACFSRDAEKFSRPAQVTHDGQQSLAPILGSPVGWTDAQIVSDSAEMVSYRYRLQSLFEFYLTGCSPNNEGGAMLAYSTIGKRCGRSQHNQRSSSAISSDG